MSDGQAGRTRTRGVEPWHQKHWDWKAAGNFLCGGAGAGLLGVAAMASFAGIPPLLPVLAALVIIACGLGLLMFKIGRPLRFMYVLRQPQRSWMSREAWVAGVLFPAALAALWFDKPLVLAAAAALGLVFLFCQGMILEQSKGIPAWRNPRVIALIMATGPAEGCGLYLLLAAFVPALDAAAKPVAIALAALAVVRIWTWWRYLAALGKRRRADADAGNLLRLPHVVLRRRPGAAAGAGRDRFDLARVQARPYSRSPELRSSPPAGRSSSSSSRAPPIIRASRCPTHPFAGPAFPDRR